MNRNMLWCAAVILFLAMTLIGGSKVACARQTGLAPTPPMGWNSWDAYGEDVKETDFRATADWVAKNLKVYGWEYIVVDSGWYVLDHTVGNSSEKAQFSMDEFGRYTPATNTIPSSANGAGFRPLADYLHSQGLKFGLHLMRGIPRVAVARNLAIAGSEFHAKDAADTGDACPWNSYNWGLDTSKPAAQAYYDSLAMQLAEWHVDLIKVDCISSRPYKGEEIRLIAQALKKVKWPIVLSLSPGAAPLDKAEEMAKYAQMWRISDDEWDVWFGREDFPQGVNNQFERAEKWAKFSRAGNWPDADMLAIGLLKPSPGWGEPRASRLTKDEQRTLFSLWSMMRSPLIIGANLTLCDEWTKKLLTNAEVIAIDQHSKGNHAVLTTEKAAVWVAQPEKGDGYYVAVFNRSDAPQEMRYSWKELGMDGKSYALRDLWEGKDLGNADGIRVTLAPHAAMVYAVGNVKKP